MTLLGPNDRPIQPRVPVPGDIPRKPYKEVLLVTLLCPNCRSRVAIMDHFPRTPKDVKPGDITLVDGSTAKDVQRLVCRNCRTTFPPDKAALPEYLFEKWKTDPAMNPIP